MHGYVGHFFGIENPEFFKGLQHALDQQPPAKIFASDNLITFGRNLSFLEDVKFMSVFAKQAADAVEKSVIWRTYVLCWAAFHGLRFHGDFVECACYKGTSARIVCDYVVFGKSNKHYFLYDLFEHSLEMEHHSLSEHRSTLFDEVRNRFTDLDNVHVTKGAVPEVLELTSPEKIAFLHLDMNNATAELGALNYLFERVTPGAMIILDDYGWSGYRAQKVAEDLFFAERGYKVLELPTGQGLVIK